MPDKDWDEKKRKKKRLSKFNFEGDGCAVALVGDFQGGPANGVTTLVTKSTQDISEEDVEKAESDQLEKNSQPSVASQGEDVVKTEGKETVKPEEEVNKMTQETQVTDESVQEMIKKALAEQESAIRESVTEELTKSFEEKEKERSAELEILKAKEEAREEKAFIAKAADYKEHLSAEDSEQHESVQALAKALRKADSDEEMKPLVDLAKSLKDTVEKSALLDEMGGVSVEKADEKYDTEGDKMVKKMVADEGVTEAEAYAKLMTDRPELFQ